MTSPVAACANHPAREAIGICVQCRTRVCSECSTKVEGINYCVACLSRLATDRQRRRSSPAAGARSGYVGYLAAVAYLTTLTLLVWLFLEVMMPGGA